MNFGNIKRERIYKHTELEQREADRLKPLMESAFKDEFSRYTGKRKNIGEERLRFASEQYANRARIARNMGVTPLYEDANIFGESMPQLKNLFESASMSLPGNVIGMGNVVNPDSSWQHTGGIHNPGYKSGSGDVPSYVFGLQSQLALNCIGFDLMPTIAVDTPKVVITYIDTVYGGGKFDDAENMPSYVELSAPVFKRSYIKTNALKRATTELVIRANDGKAMKVRFMVGSTIKAAVTVEVLGTGTSTIDAGVITYTWNNTITVKAVVDAVNAAAGAKVFHVTPETAATGIEIVNLAINFASATRTNIAEAASNNNSIGGMIRAQHEKGGKHKLNIVAMDKQLEMVGIEIDADTNNIQIKDMAAIGVNVISYLYSGVQNQLVQTLDETILDHLYKLGVTHALNVYQSQGTNYSLYIDAPSSTTLAMSSIDVEFTDILGNDVRTEMGNLTNVLVSSTYENQMTHADRLYARILLVSEFVGQQNRLAPPDFMVIGGTIASCLKKNSTFTACPVATTLAAKPELHYSGTIFETINVYKNPKIDFTDPRILLGRRGDDTDPGAKFLAYDLASSRQIVAEGTMSDKIRVWSRFAIADVGFYPELNYYTFVAINNFQWA
jgi:hypothetical protein